eukprot:1136818-Pelagomonas_calceolata.AAC.3
MKKVAHCSGRVEHMFRSAPFDMLVHFNGSTLSLSNSTITLRNATLNLWDSVLELNNSQVLLYNSTLGLYGSSQTVADVDAIQGVTCGILPGQF